MEILSALWDSGILGGLATMIVTVLGQLAALNTQKFSAVLEALQRQQCADVASHDAAFARSGDDGARFRRIMYFSAFFVLAICPFVFAFFRDIPVADRAGRRLAVGADSGEGSIQDCLCSGVLFGG